jgi:4-oxalocrotonate tautomerase
MPHVVVKVASGKSNEQKVRLAAAITKDVVDILGVGEDAVSVAIEEVERAVWAEAVYRPDIREKWETLYKKPGYDPFAK